MQAAGVLRRMRKAKQEALWRRHMDQEVLARLLESAFSLVFVLKYQPGELSRLGRLRGQLAEDYSRVFG